MSALVRKEIRQLLPAWSAAMILAIAPAWLIPLWVFHHGDDARALAFAAFCLGTLLVSLSTFGQEFGAGTFQQLLAQPAARSRLWRVKATTLAVALLLAWVAFLASYGFRIAGLEELSSLGFLALLSATVACVLAAGGLWTTLLLRQVAAGFWLAIFAPVMMLYSVLVVLEKVLGLTPPFPPWTEFTLSGAYAVLGFYWAHRLFVRAQDVSWSGGTIAFPGWLRFRTRDGSAGLPVRRNPLWALFWKELQLQQVGLLVAATALLLQIVTLGLWSLNGTPEESSKTFWFDWMVVVCWIALWATLPFLLGSLAVAEERKQGTQESALGLPVRARTQFGVKIGVALMLSVLLAALLPWTIGGVAFSFGMHGVPFDSPFELEDLRVLVFLSSCITAVCFYASTLSRTSLQAMGIAIVFSVLLSSMVAGYFNLSYVLGLPLWQQWRLTAAIGFPGLTACLVWLAYRNFRQLQIGRADWIRNLLIWVACLAFIFTTSPLVYSRFWESFEKLEPTHGPKQLSGAVRPKIGSSGRKLFVLLPEGRLWVATHTKNKFLYTVHEGKDDRDIHYPVPVDGEFVGGSNWVKLATDWRRAYAIRRDGTLWRFSVPPGSYELTNTQPVRVGGDSNWTDVTGGGGGSFLMLRTDGTLWGWGYNNSFQLGPGPGPFTNEPVRIGTNSDWAAAFACVGTSVGVKRDGSVWKWGQLLSGPHGRKGWKSGPYADPIRWDLNGKDWIEASGLDGDLVLSRDGSIQVSGVLAKNLLDNFNPEFGDKPVHLGRGSDWTSVATMERAILAVKRDGTLVKSQVFNGSTPLRFGSIQEPSRYSDWLAVQAAWSDPYVALAADGTLTSWWEGDPDRFTAGRAYLGPSRRPLWSLNILQTTKHTKKESESSVLPVPGFFFCWIPYCSELHNASRLQRPSTAR